MKPRINVYLEDHVAAQLKLVCKRPGANKSRIVNDVLDRHFNPKKDSETNSALLRRLDSMSNAMERMDRNQSIAVETLALFIRYFLTITPPLAQDDQAHAHALGKERFEVFVAQVGRRLAQDKNLLSEVLETIADTRPDLFAVDPNQAANAKPEAQFAPSVAEEADDDLPPLKPVVFDEADQFDDLDVDDFDNTEFEDDDLPEGMIEEVDHG